MTELLISMSDSVTEPSLTAHGACTIGGAMSIAPITYYGSYPWGPSPQVHACRALRGPPIQHGVCTYCGARDAAATIDIFRLVDVIVIDCLSRFLRPLINPRRRMMVIMVPDWTRLRMPARVGKRIRAGLAVRARAASGAARLSCPCRRPDRWSTA